MISRIWLLMLLCTAPLWSQINFTTYYIPSWPPSITNPGPVLSTGTVSAVNFNWGSGQVLNSGRNTQVLVHFAGTINWPTTSTVPPGTQKTVTFYIMSDDGFSLNIGGNAIINDIGHLQGASSYNYRVSVTLTAGQTYSFDAWVSQWGGATVANMFWDTGDGHGIVSVPASVFVPPPPAPVYTSAITASQQLRVTAYTTRTITNNSVYIDQIGDFNTVSVTQVGNKNLLTGVTGQNARIYGSFNTVTIRQGDQPTDTGKNEVDLDVEGSYNRLNLNQAVDVNGASVGSTSGHYQLALIQGSSNQLTTQQTNGGSGSHYLENAITGNSNVLTEYQKDNGGKLLFVNVNGDSNTVTTTQQGSGSHYLDISLTGNSNSVAATQTGSASHHATINLTNAGGPASVTLNQNSSVTGLVYSITQSCTTPAGCSVAITQP